MNTYFLSGELDHESSLMIHKQLVKYLRRGKTDDCMLYIDSHGGRVQKGLEILEVLQTYYTNVYSKVKEASSMAGIIAFSTYIQEAEQLHTHTVRCYVEGELVVGKHKKYATNDVEYSLYLIAINISFTVLKYLNEEERESFDKGEDVYLRSYDSKKRALFSKNRIKRTHKLDQLKEMFINY